MDTPLGGERLSESGVERVLDVAHKKGKVNNHFESFANHHTQYP